MTGWPRAVLLDFYGTVVAEDDTVIAAICDEIAAGSGYLARDVSAAWAEGFTSGCAASHDTAFRTQRDIERSSLAEVLARFGHDADADAMCERLFAQWRQPPLYRDAQTFLDTIGLPVCIVSNIDRADLTAALAHHGLAVHDVVTSEDVRAYKPRPEPFGAAPAWSGPA